MAGSNLPVLRTYFHETLSIYRIIAIPLFLNYISKPKDIDFCKMKTQFNC